MKNLTIQTATTVKILLILAIVPSILFLSGSKNPSSARVSNTLDNNSCSYAIDDLIGKYSIKVGGAGLIDKHAGTGLYQGNFNIPGVNGSPYKMYLYWTLRKNTKDTDIQININGSGLKNITANQAFGPAVLYGNDTTYWGYIADITSMGNEIRVNNSNNFTIRKTIGSSNAEIFGAGILLIHRDPSLSQDRHIEVKCGFDGTFYRNLGSQPTVTKWGEWSNVVCHQFAFDNIDRKINYYAFMSGTKRKTSSNYRPNSLWYITGSTQAQLNNIKTLNKTGGVANQGINSISGNKKEYPDFFNALSENEWDTVNFANDQLQIPAGHNFICFQTQSVDRAPILHPILPNYGWGSSMQWSMSALSFSSSNLANPPTATPISATPIPEGGTTATPTPIDTPTSTPTPTPEVHYPWINTIGGNTYSRTFNQTHLSSGQIITKTSLPFDGVEAFLSTDLYLQPIGSAAPARASARNAHKTAYVDANSQYKSGVSWYGYFSQYLRNSTLNIILSPLWDSSISTEKTSDIHPTGNLNDVIVYTLDGDLSLDIRLCDSKSIFLIDGNLTITPNLVTQGYANGCLFIVSGTTKVTEGFAGGSTDFPSNTIYDEVHGYFVTNNFETMTDSSGDGLYIKGGVVEIAPNPGENLSMSLNRDLGIIRNQYSPSEIIEYDPRYLYIYGDLLTYVYGYNIRESQFIRTL